MAFRSSLQSAARLGGPGAPAPALPQRLRDRTAQRPAHALRRNCGFVSAGPNRLARGPGSTPSVWVGGRRFSNSGSNRKGRLCGFCRFFFKSCARRALTRLAKFLFFGNPENAWGGPGGDLGENTGMAWPNHPDFGGRPSPIPIDLVVPLRRRREARRRIPMLCLKDRPEEALPLPWLASLPQEGQQSIEMPFNRHLKRRDCVSSRFRDRAPGARARAMV